MADGLSDYGQEGALRLLLNRSSPVPSGTVYLAVGTSVAAESDVDSWPSEVSGGGYQRQVIDFLPVVTAAPGSVSARSVFFPTASASWGSIWFWSIWTAQSAGKMLAAGQFSSALTIGSGATLRVPKGAVKICAYTPVGSGTKFSTYLHKKLGDHIFAKQAYSSPSIYLALAGTQPTMDTTGSQLNEQSGNGYARKAWSAWNDPAQSSGNGRATNNGAINFNTATANWSVFPVYLVLTDASSGGNVLCWNTCGGGMINNGDTPHFNDAAIGVETRNL